MKAHLYRLLFAQGLAYRSPRWYAVADWLLQRISTRQLFSELLEQTDS